MYIVPHFFIYKWERISSEDYTLIIDIPKDYQSRLTASYPENFDFISLQTKFEPIIYSIGNADLDARRKMMKNILMEVTNDHHKQFLESIGFSKEFDPFKLKTWHHEFDLEKVPQVPIFEIQEKPSIRITTIKDFLVENDIKNTLVKRLMEEVNRPEELKEPTSPIPIKSCHSEESNSTADNLSTCPNLSKYISPALLKKIQAKEEAVNMSKSIFEYSTCKMKKKRGVNDLKEVVEQLKTVFICQKTPTIGLFELVNKIHNSSQNIKANYSLGKNQY